MMTIFKNTDSWSAKVCWLKEICGENKKKLAFLASFVFYCNDLFPVEFHEGGHVPPQAFNFFIWLHGDGVGDISLNVFAQ